MNELLRVEVDVWRICLAQSCLITCMTDHGNVATANLRYRTLQHVLAYIDGAAQHAEYEIGDKPSTLGPRDEGEWIAQGLVDLAGFALQSKYLLQNNNVGIDDVQKHMQKLASARACVVAAAKACEASVANTSEDKKQHDEQHHRPPKGTVFH